MACGEVHGPSDTACGKSVARPAFANVGASVIATVIATLTLDAERWHCCEVIDHSAISTPQVNQGAIVGVVITALPASRYSVCVANASAPAARTM